MAPPLLLLLGRVRDCPLATAIYAHTHRQLTRTRMHYCFSFEPQIPIQYSCVAYLSMTIISTLPVEVLV